MKYNETAWNIRIDYEAAKELGLTPKESRARLRGAGIPYERLFPIDKKEEALTTLGNVTQQTGVPIEIYECVLMYL